MSEPSAVRSIIVGLIIENLTLGAVCLGCFALNHSTAAAWALGALIVNTCGTTVKYRQ